MLDRKKLLFLLVILMYRKIFSKKGFTLAEMLVVLILLCTLSGFFLQSFTFVMEQYQHRLALLELEENLSISMEYIAKDLSESIGVVACKSDSLKLQTLDGKVDYTLGTDQQADEHFYDLKGKILYRRENTQQNRQPMANYISCFRIVYYDENGNYTEESSQVCAVEILLEGQWKETVITQKRIARLKDSYYF